MRLLYATDLHGHKGKYRQLLRLARERCVELVVNGGDLLPKSADMHADQLRFLDAFLDRHLGEYDAAGIYHVSYLGNDDLRVHDERFDAICKAHRRAVNLAQVRLELGGYDWIGMNWVDDYPFRLKDRCRMDRPGDTPGPQLGPALLSTHEGFQVLDDWGLYVEMLPTIEQELAHLPLPRDPEGAIYVIHTPPAGLGLDECAHGAAVGSAALHTFIKTHQPRLTLHGHIHESPDISGVWRSRLGRTWCVQPGQPGPLSCVLIDLASMEMERIIA